MSGTTAARTEGALILNFCSGYGLESLWAGVAVLWRRHFESSRGHVGARRGKPGR